MIGGLEVQHIAAGYGDIRILWDFSTSIWPGKVTLLFGRNGAGKTTALSSIAGVVKISGGTIQLAGEEISHLSILQRTRLGIALVQENKRIFRRRTVEENLRIGGFWRYRSGKELDQALAREYERFPVLAKKKKQAAATLSGGEQQMLAISQALVCRPVILMLDEPFAGLAPEITARVLHTITQLKNEGIGILLVEQPLDELLQIVDQVTFLELGRLILSKPAKQFENISQIKKMYLDKTNLQSNTSL
jgi:branched-chain amino acid transport system ATP-binding protein